MSKRLRLSRLYLNRNLNLNSNNRDLANSNSNGRIAHPHDQDYNENTNKPLSLSLFYGKLNSCMEKCKKRKNIKQGCCRIREKYRKESYCIKPRASKPNICPSTS